MDRRTPLEVVPEEAFPRCPARGDPGCSEPSQAARLAARPLRLNKVSAATGCPTSAGARFENRRFGGIVLGGRHPVRPLVAVARPRQALDGRVVLDRDPRRWWRFKTLWFARASYHGPFLVRAARLDGDGVVRFGENPTAAMIAVNGLAYEGSGYIREVPGATYVRGPGCYGWQVDGVGFSYRIVFEAFRPPRSRQR